MKFRLHSNNGNERYIAPEWPFIIHRDPFVKKPWWKGWRFSFVKPWEIWVIPNVTLEEKNLSTYVLPTTTSVGLGFKNEKGEP